MSRWQKSAGTTCPRRGGALGSTAVVCSVLPLSYFNCGEEVIIASSQSRQKGDPDAKKNFENDARYKLLELGGKAVGEIIELAVQSPSRGIFPDYLIKEISEELWLIEGDGPAVGWSEEKLEEVRQIDFALSFTRTVKEPVFWNWREIEKIVPDEGIIEWAKLYGLPTVKRLPEVERLPEVVEDLPQVETPIEPKAPPKASEDQASRCICTSTPVLLIILLNVLGA